MPHILCNYLFELSQIFNSFYEAMPVMREKDPDRQTFRLGIISATAQIIKNGLYLLGIEAPTEM
jgi:arginyl-tRNA synthetase